MDTLAENGIYRFRFNGVWWMEKMTGNAEWFPIRLFKKEQDALLAARDVGLAWRTGSETLN